MNSNRRFYLFVKKVSVAIGIKFPDNKVGPYEILKNLREREGLPPLNRRLLKEWALRKYKLNQYNEPLSIDASVTVCSSEPKITHVFTNKEKNESRKEQYKEYLKSSHWRAFRKEIIEDRNGKCEICGSSEKLHVHHKTYANIFCEQKEDVELLCERCHKGIHNSKDGDKIKKLERQIEQIKKHMWA